MVKQCTYHFCSIITRSHLGYVLALFESLQSHANQPVEMYVLVVDSIDKEVDLPVGVILLSLDDLSELAEPFIEKYKDIRSALRWALKPVLIVLVTKSIINGKIRA